MSDRSEIAAAVKEAFDDSGDVIVAATLKRGTPIYNPATGSASIGQVTSSCRILYDEVNPTISQLMIGTEIRPGDKNVWVEGPSFSPAAGDTISVSGKPDMTVLFANNVVELDCLYLVVGR